MKRTLSLIAVALTVVLLVVLPGGVVGADVLTSSTTTMPLTTTTTWYDCISTTTTYPPTTTTSLNLTGPDGIAPEYQTTTLPTTTTTTLNLTGPDGISPEYTTDYPTTTTTYYQDTVCGPDLLTTARVVTDDTVSVLAGPYQDMGFCADSYSNSGGTIAVVPSNGSLADLATYRYLHITVNSNMPFSVMLNDRENAVKTESAAWFAAAMNSEEEIIAEGKYVAVIDLQQCYESTLGTLSTSVSIASIEIEVYEAGSISVGHIALSKDAVCTMLPPAIQTTTFPSFPDWNVTTTTAPTTNPTIGDALLPGDVDGDGYLDTSDARNILRYLIDSTLLSGDSIFLADYNGDGDVTTKDVRALLIAIL